jgi:drug/metabolite transporter (DMT)-like permease
LTNKRENTLGIIYLLLTALCWGFVASTVKRLTQEVDPYTISFSRVALATVVFAALFIGHKGDWRRLEWLLPWIIVGALGRAGNYLFYNTGLMYAPSNAATILAPVQAIGTVLLARWFLGEGVRSKWLGLTLSIGGLLLIWWNGKGWQALSDPQHVWGNVLLVLAGLASAFQFTSQKALSAKLSGIEILLPVFAVSTVITTPFAWSAGGFSRAYSLTTWAWVLFLGFALTGASFFFLAEGYKRCDASTAVVITNTSTFLTLLWSAVLLNESVSAVMIAGTALGVMGTLAVIWSDQKRADKQVYPESQKGYYNPLRD